MALSPLQTWEQGCNGSSERTDVVHARTLENLPYHAYEYTKNLPMYGVCSLKHMESITQNYVHKVTDY